MISEFGKGFFTAIFSILIALVLTKWVILLLHLHQPTPAQIFGCEKNYINERGEDTGECQ